MSSSAVTAPPESSRSAADADRLIDAMVALPSRDASRPALRESVIEAWLPIAKHLASRYAGRGEANDELLGVALAGLVSAVDRYRPDRGADFAGFAVPTIIDELKRHFRDRPWSTRTPLRLQELRQAIAGVNNTLTDTLGRSPTVADVSAQLGLSEEDVIEGLETTWAGSSPGPAAPRPDTLGGGTTGSAATRGTGRLGALSRLLGRAFDRLAVPQTS